SDDARKTRVWDAQTGKLHREVSGWVGRFTPDGTQVVTSSWANFHVYELATGKEIRGFKGDWALWNFALANSGTRLWVVSEQGGQVLDWKTGKKLNTFPWTVNDPTVLSSDGRFLLQQVGGKPPLRVL